MTEIQLNQLSELFSNDELSFIEQGIILVETLCTTEEQFRTFLSMYGQTELPAEPSLEQVIALFENA